MASTYSEIRQRLDQGFTTMRQFTIVLICFLLNMADGFDVIAISMTAPSIADDWGVSPSMLGWVLSAEMLGMTIGALYLSTLSDKFGRRPTIIGSVALVSLAMILTAFCSGVTELVLLRLITGIGIGGVLVSAVSLSSEYAPENRRHAVTIAMSTFFAIGTIVAGPIINKVLSVGHWQDVFLIGGCFGVGLFVLALFGLPESLEYLSNQNDEEDKRQARLDHINSILRKLQYEPVGALLLDEQTKDIKAGSVKELLSKNYRSQTIQLWLIFFLGYWLAYLVLKWMPKLLVNMEFDLSIAINALTIYMIGGVIGSAIAAMISTRVDARIISKVGMLIFGVMFLVFSFIEPRSINQVYVWFFILSMVGTGAFNSIFALSATSYPSQLRASGFGYCIGIGRSGAIISPIVAGVLVQDGWSMYGIYALLAAPAAILCAIFIQRLRLVKDDEVVAE